MIKLIALDVDGVLTDGRKYYDSSGNVTLKTFCDKDWTAIKRFKAIGIPVIFITGDPYNAKILENRNLPYIVNRGKGFHSDKVNYLEEICTTYNVTPNDICYVGDDIFDIGFLRKIGYGYCTEDAPSIVKKYATNIKAKGGDHVVVALFEELENKKFIPSFSYDDIINKIYEIDIKESF